MKILIYKISNRFSKIDYKLFCLTVNTKFIIINIGLHLESDGLSLKGLFSNPDHLGRFVLHPVHSLPVHHLRDCPELSPDFVFFRLTGSGLYTASFR